MLARSRWRSAGARTTVVLAVAFGLRLTANEGVERVRLRVEAALAAPLASFPHGTVAVPPPDGDPVATVSVHTAPREQLGRSTPTRTV